jgi:hypothetical protein
VGESGWPAFSVRIPETWFEFDVWRATRTGDLARMVDQRMLAFPELRPRRAAILRGLRQLVENAERRGALYCAAAADRVDDDGMLLASLMVFNTSGMPEPAANTVEAIAAQLSASPANGAGAAPTGAASPANGAGAWDGFTPWRKVRVLDLDAGRAVRVCGVTSHESPDGTKTLPVVSMQTLIPIPGSDGVLNVVLASPVASMAEGLLDLFDAISATLAWASGPTPG